MRRGAVWLVTLPIALVGVLAAHGLANAALGSPEGTAEVFASPASGAELVPALAALALAAVLLGLGGWALGYGQATRSGRSLALPFAALPPAAFVLLELLEEAPHAGGLSVSFAFEPAFLGGLVLQLPFALVGYLVARALLRLGEGVRRLIAARPPVLALTSAPARRSSTAGRPRSASPGWAHSGRAPPPRTPASR